MFIFSALAEDDHIQAIRVPIDDATVNSASKSIQSIIKTATETLSRIESQYKSSTHVLREVEVELATLEAKASFNKASRGFKKFFQFIVTASTLASNL